ncbi:MAG: ABC transporter permease [Gemmatimonadaceae bacterium]
MSSVPRTASSYPLLSLAIRESRSSRRTLLLYMSSIALGVAALVAIDSFSANVTRSVRDQSRSLLGGDLAITGRAPFAQATDSLLDSLARTGIDVARVTTFAAMGVVNRTGRTRLVQTRAVTPGYPFYGVITTEPNEAWSTLQSGRNALVDPALLISLGARLGDTLTIGYARFAIAGTLRQVPGDNGITAAIGPRVFLPARFLPETQLLGFGSRADYEAVLRLPDRLPAARLVAALRPRMEAARLRTRTVQETEANLTDAIRRLRDFLGIVGLAALLLGGIGVASGVNAFVRRKIDTVAVLRCLGATSRQVLSIYVAQAAALGLVGASVGVALGLAMQFALPRVLGQIMPVDVSVHPVPVALLSGLAVGVWVALAFSLRPLVALRNISPLQTLRRDADADALRRRGRDWLRTTATMVIVASIFAIAVARAPSLRQGLGLGGAVGVAIALLAVAAAGAIVIARRSVRPAWPFALRQGIANLYRPANQTHAVVLALGFGVFLVSTVYQLQTNILRMLDTSVDRAAANVVFFDVQEDQARGVDSLVRAEGFHIRSETPLVQMRIVAINGRTVSEILADSTRGRRGGWALRREYRSTYRDTVVASEAITAGRWFDRAPKPAGDTGRVSLDQGVARELGIAVGDAMTWDVQGVKVPTRVTSLREVNFARFEPNFFAVFDRATLEHAPKQFVFLASVPTDTAVSRLQRAVVGRYPNVASLDLSLIQSTIARILSKVSVAIRFMALFSLAMGIPVLFSSVAATRRERLREGVLLKTLGATRAQIARILLAEYGVLGALGSITGVALSVAAAWALTHFVFDQHFSPAWPAALAIIGGMVLLSLSIGVLTGRDVFRETAMKALQQN